MKTNITDISPPILYLARFWFSSYGAKCCQPIKLQDSLKCNFLRKKWMMKYIFDMQINIKFFYKLINHHFGCVQPDMPKVPTIRSLHIFAISPEKHGGWRWYFSCKKNVKVFYKIIVPLWVWVVRHAQVPKITSLQYLSNMSRKT